MTKFDLLKEMMLLIDDYEKAGKTEMQTEQFVLWLNEQILGISAKTTVNENEQNSEAVSEWRISYYVSLLNKYAKIYVKKALKGSSILSLDDFGFLITLCFEGSKTKTELIQSNISEVSSGMEMIKRMERNGLIKSSKDDVDKRAIRITATPKGQQTLGQLMAKMQEATNIIAGNLTVSERLHLLTLLNKLHQFHNPIYLNDLKSENSEIREKYL
jgi:DNA-binding MarR family transcriptional regulator